jgi:hypothetical protein
MSTPKRHHYVPRFILANFVDAIGKLWVRRVDGGKVWSAVPEDVYVERHRYSSVDETGSRDPELEKAYSVLEGLAKPIVDRFLAAGRSGAPPVITVAEKAVWDEFLYHQMKRVPAAMSALEKKQGWSERLDAAIERLRERGLVADEETLAELRSPKGLVRLQQNATVKALSADSPLVRILLGAASVEIGVAPTGASFVISSHPIAGIRAGLQSVGSGGSEMWLPIASDVAARVAFNGELRTVALTKDKVESINRDSRSQGDFLAGNSKDLVESVT